MRLLYINHYAGGPAYGMEHRPYYLAREWTRAGHDVLLVGASFSHLRSRQPEITGTYSREDRDGIRFVWCRTPAYTGNGAGRVLNIATFLYRLRRRRRWLDMVPDVVIASSTYPADMGVARRIAAAHGALLVWEVHDIWPLSPIELGGMSPRHPFIAWMQRAENAACRDADLVVSMLPLAEAHLRQHGLPAGRFAYVPNGVDPDEWSDDSEHDAGSVLPAGHAAAIAEARARGDLLVGYAGGHGVSNDLEALLDTATLLRDDPVTVLLVGDGPEKPRLERLAAERGLDRVRFLDPVPKAAVPALLRRMDVLYLGLQPKPLYRFGISLNKLMDYMMAGRPIVNAAAAGNDPVAEAGCGITVAPGHPEATAAAIRRLAAMSPDERDTMGMRGHDYIRARQTYPVLAARFLEAIEAARARRGAGA